MGIFRGCMRVVGALLVAFMICSAGPGFAVSPEEKAQFDWTANQIREFCGEIIESNRIKTLSDAEFSETLQGFEAVIVVFGGMDALSPKNQALLSKGLTACYKYYAIEASLRQIKR
jgi:hypothetical protein